MSKGKRIAELMKKHRKGCRIFLILVILLIIVCVIGAVWHKFQKKDAQQGQEALQTSPLKKRDLTTSVSVTGTIASADKREVVTNLEGTEVTQIAVAVGDYVNAGDTVIVFDDTDLKEAYETSEDEYELSVLKQNQSLEQAKDSVTEAQETYDKGVSQQAELVSGALSDYRAAQSKEAEALAAYEAAQKATEKAQQAYQEIKEKKSELKSAMNQAQKEEQKKQTALGEAQAAYEAAEANIKYASESDANYTELNRIYKDAYAAYVQAQKEADEAQKKAEQAKNAYDSVEQAKQAYEQAEETEKAAKAAYEEAVGQSSEKSSAYNQAVETQADTNEKNAENIEDSKENLTITGKEVSNNQASQSKQLKEAEEKLGKCVVTSPISGYITAMGVSVGDTYNGSDTLFVVQDMSSLVVDATVDEYDIASLKKDQEAVIKTDATGDEELKGILTYVAMTPDESESGGMGSSSTSSSSASYTIQIALTDTNEALRIGMTAKTSIILESAEDVFAVAYDCVETDQDGNSYITVLDQEKVPQGKDAESTADAKAYAQSTKQIPVTVGLESDYYVEISGDGLEEGLRVVTPQTVGVSTDTDSDKGFMFGGMPGGEMPGGGNPGSGNGGGKGNGGNRGSNSGGF